MATAAPFRWTGDAMVPLRPRAADRQFVVDAEYTLGIIEPRSGPQHRFYFASVAECWRNLPDDLADEYPDAETLRKKALIRTGYLDEQSYVCRSRAEALRLAAFLAPIDRYAVIDVSEFVVRRWTAKSQSVHAMGKAEFSESVEKVLSFCASLIGVSAGDLER